MIGRLFLLLSLAEFVGLGDVWVERLVGCFAEFGGGGHFFLLIVLAFGMAGLFFFLVDGMIDGVTLMGLQMLEEATCVRVLRKGGFLFMSILAVTHQRHLDIDDFDARSLWSRLFQSPQERVKSRSSSCISIAFSCSEIAMYVFP